MKTNYLPLLVAIAVILSIAQVVMIYNLGSSDKEPSLSASDRLLLQGSSNRSAPIVAPVLNDSKLDAILAEVSKESSKDDVALSLALQELNSSDVKKEVRKVLNDEMKDSDFAGSEIESWRDVSFLVLDSDVETDKHDGKVELLVKVKFYLDGSSDSDDLEQARVKITFDIEELDVDDYSDAEAHFSGLTFVRFL